MELSFDASDLPAAFARAVDRREPAHVVGALDCAPAVAAWTAKGIAQRYANTPCSVARDGRPAFSDEMTTYADFFGERGGPPLAASTYTFTRRAYDGTDRAFVEDFGFPNPYFADADVQRHILFAGPAQAGALPHQHGDALNFLVSGEKRWVLFDADPAAPGRPLFDRYWETYREGAQSATWFEEAYPGLAAAPGVQRFEFVQRAGDLVYVPRRFCHTVLNLTPVLGIVLEVALGAD